MSDTQGLGQEPSSDDLDIQSAMESFGNILEPKEVKEKTLPEQAQALEQGEEVAETEPADEAEDTPAKPTITVEVDGKTVELTAEQVAEAYKSGLRQSDYSKKTEEVSLERKKITQERNDYAQKLNNISIQLEGALQEQSQIDWEKLLNTDPVEYLKQDHLLKQRQATLLEAKQQSQQIAQQQQQEISQTYNEYLKEESNKLLEKIPAWRDETKLNAERAEIKSFLKNQGITEEEIANITDHRHVLLIRDAMQFRKLLSEAPAATKKVEKAPLRVERSGTTTQTDEGNASKRAAMNKLSRTHKAADAIEVFKFLI